MECSDPSLHPTEENKDSDQRKSNKNNANVIEAILDGKSQSIKRKIGPCASTKELCIKLENIYSNEEITQKNLALFKYDSEYITEN